LSQNISYAVDVFHIVSANGRQVFNCLFTDLKKAKDKSKQYLKESTCICRKSYINIFVLAQVEKSIDRYIAGVFWKIFEKPSYEL
jgi:hypothetical protein